MYPFGRPLWIAVFLVCSAAVPSAGADWPMWRSEATRSGASPDTLPASLHLQWVRDLPAPLLAWPNEPRLHFDASYEPVVLGHRLFLGSPNDGSVAAFATDTGAEQWRFYTEGPVRFAPVAWRGRVYAGSDDGWLYCLDAAKGAVLWKARGAPDGRPDRRHLGNARLLSFWPVRGGPVLADGTAYFAAGIWPTLGVFVVAVDAQSGKLVWRNREAHFIEKVRIDHNTLHDSGLSPQGYLAVAGDTLLVPNGRSMPAVLDRRTGKLRHYVQGYRNGDCRVTTEGTYAFVGESGVVDVRTGREVGSRWAAAGKDAPPTFDIRKFALFEGPIFAYKLFPGCSWRSALVPGIAYGSRQGVFYAYDLSRAKTSEYERKAFGHTHKPWRWDAPELWKLATPQAKSKGASDVVIKAGSRLYGHVGTTLAAIELPAGGGQPKVAWHKPVAGTPSSLLAADGRLFVVTREGQIHCFGAAAGQPIRHPLDAAPLPKPSDAWARTAAEILGRTGVSQGYGLVLGLGSGRLLEALLQGSELKLIGVDASREKVDALRRRLTAAGVYGTRAELLVGEPFDFPFPPYLASLIVSEDLEAAGFSTRRPAAKLFEVLRPYGGAACLAVAPAAREGFERWVASGRLESAKVERAGRFVLLRRVGALPGSAAWTHESADAARSYFSRDERVKAPLGVLWYGDGADHGFWKRKDYGVGVKPQVVGGRLFAYQICTRTMFAYDVYTGRQLWKRQVEPFTRYASMPDGVYVAGGDACEVLDPAAGTPLKTFRYKVDDPQGRKPAVADVRVGDDVVVIAAGFAKARSLDKGLWDSTVLVALDRASGRQLWARMAKQRFNYHALAVGDGVVFCTDSLSPAVGDKAARRGDLPKSAPATILALDARTGKPRWTAEATHPYRAGVGLGIRSVDDWLAYCAPHGLLLAGRGRQGGAYDAKSGKQVWQAGIGTQPLILRGDTFIPQSGAVYDARTGKPTGERTRFTHGGCNYAVANPHLLFVRSRSVCFVETANNTAHYLRNVRSGCSNSLIAADGLLNVPCFSVGCVCNYPIQTAFALVHMPEVGPWAGTKPIQLPDRAAAAASRNRK